MRWNEFWEIVDNGVKDIDVLKKSLNTLSEQDLIDFYDTEQELVELLMESKYKERVKKPFDEVYFDALCHWVVRQGYEYYEDVSYDATKFPSELSENDYSPTLASLADEIYKKRFNKPIRKLNKKNDTRQSTAQIKRKPSVPPKDTQWNEFWKIVNTDSKDTELIKRKIKTLSEQELVDLFWTADEYATLFLNYDAYWDKMGDYPSEDGLKDVGYWVVQQGENYYVKVIQDPSKFPEKIPEGDDGFDLISFVAGEYEKRYGQNIRTPEEDAPKNTQ